MDVVEAGLVVEIHGQEAQSAEIGQPFEEVGQVDASQRLRGFKEVEEGLGDFAEGGFEFGHDGGDFRGAIIGIYYCFLG